MYKPGDRIFTTNKFYGCRRKGTITHVDEAEDIVLVSLDFEQTGCDDCHKDRDLSVDEIEPLEEECYNQGACL
jgi:hypothetical protein